MVEQQWNRTCRACTDLDWRASVTPRLSPHPEQESQPRDRLADLVTLLVAQHFGTAPRHLHRFTADGLSHVLPSSIVDAGATIGHVQEDGSDICRRFVSAMGGALEILVDDWQGSE